MSGYNIHTVNEIGCKWSLKGHGKILGISERKPALVHFTERSDKTVIIKIEKNFYVTVDPATFEAKTTSDISQASVFRIHHDPFESSNDTETVSFELLNSAPRRWLRHFSFGLRADETGVGASFLLDATFVPVRVKEAPSTASSTPRPPKLGRATPKKIEESEHRPRLSTGTPARPQRKRPPPPDEELNDEFSEFKLKIAKLQNLDNWL